MLRPGRWPWYGLAAIGVAGITLAIAGLQPYVAANRLQMSYLLLVLALAILGGQGPAALASVLAFLAYDFFFVPPVRLLTPRDPGEWFALGLFLTVGLSTGQLAANLQDRAREARQRTSEALTLYDLTTALLADATLDEILHDVVERLMIALAIPAAVIRLRSADGYLAIAAGAHVSLSWWPQIESDMVPDACLIPPAPAEARALSGNRAGNPHLLSLDSPIVLDGSLLGVVSAYNTAELPPFTDTARRLVPAFAAQTALAMGRLRLAEEQERVRMAEESNRLKSVLLASVSHDLRTPLTTIRTSAAFLRGHLPQPDWIEAASNIEDESDRLRHLVDNLLEMSRLEAGGVPLHRTPEEAAELVGVVARRITPILDGRTLRLITPADPLTILVDGPKILRVLVNLLENAVKFSAPASEIRVDAVREQMRAILRVHNVGPPVPEEEQERIFDKFQRVQHIGHRDTTGTGLGLAISKGIVEAHSGSIWVRNEDQGVAFYVALPLVVPDEVMPAEAAGV